MRFRCFGADDGSSKVTQRFRRGRCCALRGYSPKTCSKPSQVGAVMEDGQSKGRSADQIDFPVLWVVVRGIQILLIVIYTKITYLSFGTGSFGADLTGSIGLLLIIGVFVH